MPLTLQWTFAHIDPVEHIACASMNDDGRSMTPDSHYRNTFFNLSEFGLIFQSLRKPWSMPLNVPYVSLDQLLYQLRNTSVPNMEGTPTRKSAC